MDRKRERERQRRQEKEGARYFPDTPGTPLTRPSERQGLEGGRGGAQAHPLPAPRCFVHYYTSSSFSFSPSGRRPSSSFSFSKQVGGLLAVGSQLER